MRWFLVLTLCVGCVSPKRIARASSQVELGTAYYREGQVELAIQTLTNAGRIDPANWRARSNLAIAYVAKGRPDLAERAFKAALRINPGEAEILNNYGSFLLAQGRPDDALEAFTKALADLEYRSPAVIYSNLSAALLAKGRPVDALKAAEEAVHRVPNLCEGYYQIAEVQKAQSNLVGALDAYARLGKACPKEALNAQVAAGCLQMSKGQADLGEMALQEVLAASEDTAAAKQARACLGGE